MKVNGLWEVVSPLSDGLVYLIQRLEECSLAHGDCYGCPLKKQCLGIYDSHCNRVIPVKVGKRAFKQIMKYCVR